MKSVIQALDGFNLTAKQLGVLGFDPKARESDLQGLLRVLIIALAGRAGNPQVIQQAKERFARFTDPRSPDLKAIHPDLQGPLFCIVVGEGGQSEFDAVLKVYRETATSDQKIHSLRALGSSKHPEIIKQALNLIFDPATAWAFVQENCCFLSWKHFSA